MCNVRHMSKEMNLIWPSDASLQHPHCSTHGHSWKSEGFYLETSFLYNLGFRKEFLWGRVLLFALQLSAEYTWNRTIAAPTIAFSFPTIRLNFILLSSTLRWTGCHVTSARQPGNTGSCPSTTCKNTSFALILSFKHGSNSNAMCKIIFCLAEGFNFHLI